VNKLAEYERRLADNTRKNNWERILERVDNQDMDKLAELFVAGCIGFVLGFVAAFLTVQVMLGNTGG
jgi:hypothetical protein